MSPWPALRIDYHDSDLGPLIDQPIRQAIPRLREVTSSPVIVRPGWQSGPHVLIAAHVRQDEFYDRIAPLLHGRIEPWIREHPSNVRLDDEEYGRLSRQIAAAEGAPVPKVPIMANNVISPAQYRLPPPLGEPALSGPRDVFMADATEACLDLLDSRLQCREDVFHALFDVLALFEELGPRFDFWPLSMEAHGSAHLQRHPHLLAPFQRAAGRFNETRRSRSAIDRSGLDSAGSGTSAMRNALLRLHRDLTERVDADMADRAARDLVGVGWDARSLAGSFDPVQILRSTTHLVYRIMVNFLYATFPLIGLRPADRAFLCYVTWQEISRCDARVETAHQSLKLLANGA